MRLTVAVFFALSCATAQTYVVDVANGPGTDFTMIDAAVAAVPDGATLRVRAGYYPGFEIDGKGLSILADGLVEIGPMQYPPYESIWVHDTLPSQRVWVRGLALHIATGHGCRAEDCAGAVVFDGLIDQGAVGTVYPGPLAMDFVNCAQALVRDSTLRPCTATASTLVMENCAVRGADLIQTAGAAAALTLTGGSTQLVACELRGSVGNRQFGPFPAQPNQPAIVINGGDVRSLHGSRLSAGTDPLFPPAVAVAGTGTIRLDPSTLLVAGVSPAIAATVSQQTIDMPAVLGTSAPGGGQLRASAPGPIGAPVILVVGLPGSPFRFPGLVDALWWNPNARTPIAIGVPGPGAPVSATVAAPSGPGFLGLCLVWQSITANVGLQASNPTLTIIF